MTILYVFDVIIPTPGVQGLPPSVMSSTYYSSLEAELARKAITSNNITGDLAGVSVIKFDTQAECDSWFATYKISDPTLKADTIAWRDAHGITYINDFYSDDGSIPPANGIIYLD